MMLGNSRNLSAWRRKCRGERMKGEEEALAVPGLGYPGCTGQRSSGGWHGAAGARGAPSASGSTAGKWDTGAFREVPPGPAWELQESLHFPHPYSMGLVSSNLWLKHTGYFSST